ncbi:S8 family serine peptidase [Actinoplanes sp. NPDC049118]|uniref:S8 family serine peptidase n=1 Tax=Actinoplanes sp. NPDC049118 TaxID=3155769 RepID=UPI0033CAFB72
MTVYRSAARTARRRDSRRLKISLLGVVAVVAAGITVPAFADTDPDVRLIVGLEAAGRQDTAEELADKGYRLKTKGRLDRLGARTLLVSEDDAAKVAARLRDQDGVAFVQLDRKVSALAEPGTEAGEAPGTEAGEAPSLEESEPAGPSPATPGTPSPSEVSSPAVEPTIGEDPNNPVGHPTESSTAPEPEPTESHLVTAAWDALAQLGVPDALRSGTGWSSQTVAVVDTGVTPVGDLAGAVLPGVNVVENAPNPADAGDDSTDGHGTAVASLVKAACPTCKILPVKALDKRGTAFESEVAQGITYAADQGARIINLSFGAPVQPGTPDAGELLQSAVDYARGKGAVVLASAGNDAYGSVKYYPAANAGVLAVSGTNSSGGRYLKSDDPDGVAGANFGATWVDLAAPYCAAALTTVGFRRQVCGSSFSTALVSGVAGLVKSRTAAANQWSIENALTSSATAPAATDKWLAYGEVRADRAVLKVDATPPVVGATTPSYMQRFRGTVTVTASNITDAGGDYPGGSGAIRAGLYADGKYVASDYSAPFSINYNSGTLNRTVKLQWKVIDRAGNTGILNRNVVADNLAPTLTWASGPKNNAKVKGTVTVTAKASDAAGVSRVELWINGKLAQWDWTSGYSFKVNTAAYGKTIKVQLRANDKVGNVRYLSTYTWKR